MADYVLIVDSEENLVEIGDRVKENFDDFRDIADNAWVIRSTTTTSKGISETLFGESPRGEGSGRHAVFRFTAFWGFHSRNIWEWLDTRDSNGG